MTVPVQDPIVQYTGNGVTKAFAVPFRILSADDLKVTVSGVLTSAYTIDGIGDDECTVTSTIAPALGVAIVIFRQVTLDRENDYQNNGDLLAITINADFDRLWMALQDGALSQSHVIQVPPTDPEPSLLPVASLRANKALVFDANGDVTVSVDDYEDQFTNVAASAAAAAVSEEAAATSASNAALSESNANTSAAESIAAAAALNFANTQLAAGIVTFNNFDLGFVVDVPAATSIDLGTVP